MSAACRRLRRPISLLLLEDFSATTPVSSVDADSESIRTGRHHLGSHSSGRYWLRSFQKETPHVDTKGVDDGGYPDQKRLDPPP